MIGKSRFSRKLPTAAAILSAIAGLNGAHAQSASVPEFAPIGAPVERYLPVPDSAKGPAVDPAKGYRLELLGPNLYMITDNIYQSMFLVYEKGVVVVDAPPEYASKIRGAIAEVTDKPITHVVYSHSHTDHIGGMRELGGHPVIIAQEETGRLLARDKDPNRPLPTRTFRDKYTLKVGSQVLELSYHGNGHEPGNIFIHAPAQRTLMVVDVISPGWMPFRRFGLSQDLPGYFEQVRLIGSMDFDKLVSGHVARVGTREDVRRQIEFNDDIRAAATRALQTTKFIETAPADPGNPWGMVADYTRRVASRCVVELTPKWRDRLAAFDVFAWDQCYAVEQSLRID